MTRCALDNSYNLHVLFQMFDRDLSESIEKSEFLQVFGAFWGYFLDYQTL